MAADKRLDGKVALVTGAASGIGFACCERFRREGASVVGADINTADATAFDLFQQLDVTDLEAQQSLVAAAVEKFGRVDILVTAAGIGDAGPVHLVEEEAWDRVPPHQGSEGTAGDLRRDAP